jgi:hypothetical protein
LLGISTSATHYEKSDKRFNNKEMDQMLRMRIELAQFMHRNSWQSWALVYERVFAMNNSATESKFKAGLRYRERGYSR